MSSCNGKQAISLKRQNQISNYRPEPIGKVLDLARVRSVNDALHPSQSQVSSLPSLPVLPPISKWHPQLIASPSCPSGVVQLQPIRAGISVAFKTSETYRSQAENH